MSVIEDLGTYLLTYLLTYLFIYLFYDVACTAKNELRHSIHIKAYHCHDENSYVTNK
jgi:hypothetical protein